MILIENFNDGLFAVILCSNLIVVLIFDYLGILFAIIEIALLFELGSVFIGLLLMFTHILISLFGGFDIVLCR